MLFKKSYNELVQTSLTNLANNTSIKNTNIGGITRSLIEIINKNISDYYEVLDINMAMSFLSTSSGYFLDLIGSLFNMPRIQATAATVTSSDSAQKFYVTSGTLADKMPSMKIVANTQVYSTDGQIVYYVTADTAFGITATSVYVPIKSVNTGSSTNIGPGVLSQTSLGISNVFTTNEKSIANGADIESDGSYRYRLMNATLSSEMANEISVRLACLSVNGVADVILRPYSRGIGTYDVIVIPTEGIASDSLVASVQSAIDIVQAYGIKGVAIKPSVVPVDIEVRLVFTDNATDFDRSTIRSGVEVAIEKYITNIPVGGTFILNELRQQIMDVDVRIKDHIITCYYFREKPTFIGNVDIYWDEMFYPNPNSANAIRVI